MIKARFLTPTQRAEQEQIVRRPSEDHGVARRANAVLLLDDGLSCVQIGKVLYFDDDTVRNWHKQYQSGGLDRLTTFDWKGGLERNQSKEISEQHRRIRAIIPAGITGGFGVETAEFFVA